MQDMEFDATLDNGMPVTIHCETEGFRILDLFAQDAAGTEVKLSPAEDARLTGQAEQEAVAQEGSRIDQTYEKYRNQGIPGNTGAGRKWIIDASTSPS